METVDTERMARVLSRVRGGGEGPPARTDPFDALAGEQAARALILAAAGKSPVCDNALAGPLRRCRARGRDLRTQRFLAGEGPGPETRPQQYAPGVLSALRALYIQLKTLESAYHDAGAEDLAGECRADADTVRDLISRALG